MRSRLALAFAAVLVGSAFTGCSSGGGRPPKPAFPLGAADCSTYCLVWIPPTYREVPHVVPCKPGCVVSKKVCVRKTEFAEVVKPGCYEPKRTPCGCREEAVVQACPGSDRWVKTKCPCTCGDCFRHEKVPPTYTICDKTVTEAGVAYCAYHEPEYDVVPRTKICVEKRDTYVPAEYGVKWSSELFQEGRWEWQKTDCAPPPRPVCAPACRPTVCAPRAGFERCPPRD